VHAAVAEELETFIADGDLWRDDRLAAMVERLTAEPDEAWRTLAVDLGAVLAHSRMGPLSKGLVADIEGVVYPRLWKLMEAVWDGLPDAELRTRVSGLDDRLAALLGTRS